jgi:hypothetical protein
MQQTDSETILKTEQCDGVRVTVTRENDGAFYVTATDRYNGEFYVTRFSKLRLALLDYARFTVCEFVTSCHVVTVNDEDACDALENKLSKMLSKARKRELRAQ